MIRTGGSFHAVQDLGQTLVIVTHDPRAASFADTVLFLADGQFKGELQAPSIEAIAARIIELGR